MAQGSTIHSFEVSLSHVDRGVYETLSLRVARHPSETIDYLLTRVLAYCLEYEPGIAFGKGIGDPEEPPVFVKDLTGKITSWIEIGSPDAARLHKATKVAARVCVYTHKPAALVLRPLEGERIHRGAEIPFFVFERPFLEALAELTDRRSIWDLSVTGGRIYLGAGKRDLETELAEHHLPE